MLGVSREVRKLLSYLLLSVPVSKYAEISNVEELQSFYKPALYIAQGKSSELINAREYANIILTNEAKAILHNYPQQSLNTTLRQYVKFVRNLLSCKLPDGDIHFQILATAMLQTFLQLNYTGPSADLSQTALFTNVDANKLQNDALKLLALEGQLVYELIVDPVILLLAGLMFEELSEINEEQSLLSESGIINVDQICVTLSDVCRGARRNALTASSLWWWTRLLQVHLSLFSEAPSVLTTVSTLLLTPDVVNCLWSASDQDVELQQHLQLIFFLESARMCIHSHTEHLAGQFLTKAKNISQLQLVLSGAKAKRTKFQTFTTSNLIVLAKSNLGSDFYKSGNVNNNLETFNLDSDLLLEKPHYESLNDLEIPELPNSKRIKMDTSSFDEQKSDDKFLPVAISQEDIPSDLRQLDPNEQPPLSDLDCIQLLLRLCALRQTSPSNDPLVEEELMALVGRILFAKSQTINWAVFGRALWERSVLETTKARTIERGILQMTSLIEEIGIKIKTKIIPTTQGDEDDSAITPSRLRFIHQLPLKPQWSLDVTLAEKYMSLGVLRSAIDIYERLQLACEAALCYAAVDNEIEAERILLARIESHPEDARAVSILGDLRQDPQLWLKAWEIGKYPKAKASLARYYYSPPAGSNIQKNLNLSIQHMHDSLTVNPLNYESWFFYGCCGLETEQYELASEAFTRCVALDETNPHAWSNLATSLVRQDKNKPALNALKKAIKTSKENKKSWKIYENYLIVAMKLHEWNDVLLAAKELIDIRGSSDGERSIDVPVIEKLVEILVSTEYPKDDEVRLTHYQRSCIDLVCNMLPKVITTSARCWRIVSRVELWRRRPWAALECHEKAYRAVSGMPELELEETIWNDAVDACSDLAASYESLGDLEGKHGAGDVVCKDWKYKARTTIRSLMSKGKSSWEDSEGWNRLQDLKEEFSN